MADYGCFPLWHCKGSVGNINPENLTLSSNLSTNLLHWAKRYDETLNDSEPQLSGFATKQEELIFVEEGLRLAQSVKAELNIEVYYFNQIIGKNIKI
ncbi:hypothetical protein [Thalassotalea litorea]|uniref:hypothetical protein n=1 Tax=Thalassotalea litorea TaxID=2020715 RepID=UPI003735740F